MSTQAIVKEAARYKPVQIESELYELTELLRTRNFQHILEIGTGGGGTLCVLARTASRDATIISVDLPGGHFGGGYHDWAYPMLKGLATDQQKLWLLREDSHSKKTLEDVQVLLNGNPLDLLMIDGDHTYQGVKQDYETYGPLVRQGGVIVFHDIVSTRSLIADDPPCEVGRFWNEIKTSHQHREIIDGSEAWAGIGVLYV